MEIRTHSLPPTLISEYLGPAAERPRCAHDEKRTTRVLAFGSKGSRRQSNENGCKQPAAFELHGKCYCRAHAAHHLFRLATQKESA